MGLAKTDVTFTLKRSQIPDAFTLDVIRLVLAIPRGRVATYGQIAELAGKPRNSRQVGFILRSVCKPDSVPWQRVLSFNGQIAFPKRNKNFKRQRQLLEAENVVFSDQTVDLSRYRWRRRPRSSKGYRQPKMFS